MSVGNNYYVIHSGTLGGIDALMPARPLNLINLSILEINLNEVTLIRYFNKLFLLPHEVHGICKL